MSETYHAHYWHKFGGYEGEGEEEHLGYFEGNIDDITVYLSKTRPSLGQLCLLPVKVTKITPQDAEEIKTLLNKQRLLQEELNNTREQLKTLGFR